MNQEKTLFFAVRSPATCRASISPNPGETVEYLSDLGFRTVSNGLGPVEKDRSNGSNGAGDGKPITINGVEFAKGLGVHANSELRYCLGGMYTKFMAEIGIDDEASPDCSVEFQVWADKEFLYTSGVMLPKAPAKKANINLAGKSELKLVVIASDTKQVNYADWADARLVRTTSPLGTLASGSTVFLSDLTFTTIANGLGPAEKDQNNGGIEASDGKPILLNGVTYRKGLGVSTESEVSYCLEGRFSAFIADVGVDDSAVATATVVFQVLVDDLLVYDSGKVSRNTPTKAISVSVLGKTQLRLFARSVTNAKAFPCDWASARLLVADTSAAAIGQWSEPKAWPFVSVHLSVLPNGKLLTWRASFAVGADIRVWNPSDNSFTPAPVPSRTPVNNIFCSGHSFLPDGRLLVTGGHIQLFVGTVYTNIYDYRTNNWSQAADMNDGRWYPTNCTIGDGDLLVIGGSSGNGQPPVMNTLPQVWKDGIGYRSLTSAVISLPLYPWVHLAPDGRVFNSGPNKTTRYLDTKGTGTWTIVADSNFGFRDYGSSVLYDEGRVLIVGGGNLPIADNRPTNTAEVIDLREASPAWKETGRMSNARRQLNATLLPDGKVLVTGGTSGSGFNDEANPVYAAEIWDPETGRWETWASMKVPRLYHSTAVLLLDGRVMCAGGGFSPSYFDYSNIEFYSPPYLFRGPRPTITSVPDDVRCKESFELETPNAAEITKVTWVRLPSVTHSFDQNQRINRLSFSRVAGGLHITAPVDKNLCPPGHYMMFLINERGVPSVGKIIKVSAPA